MMSSLLQLKRIRDALSTWFHKLEESSTPSATLPANSSARSSPYGFFSSLPFARRSPSAKSVGPTRLGLLQFLAQFHEHLLAKFTLYFHDTLAVFAPVGELKSGMGGLALLHNVQHFQRKSSARMMCILACRLDLEAPFYGFGYHKPLPNGESVTRPASGLAEKYPPLLILPSDRRMFDSLHATMTSFVQEICVGPATNPTAPPAARYCYDRNKDQSIFAVHLEANLHMVIVFDRRVQEKDATISAFVQEILLGVRGVKFFQQELRSLARV